MAATQFIKSANGSATLPQVKPDSLQRLTCGGRTLSVDYDSLNDISIGPHFETNLSVTAFGVPPSSVKPIISVREGHRCNCYAFNNYAPHLHGTHIETREHLLLDPKPVTTHLKGVAFVARLITVMPERAGTSLSLVGDKDDRVITRAVVEKALVSDTLTPQVLIIRTPNFDGKATKQYGGTNPPYPHHEVAALLVERGIEHVVLDLPSADREEGELYFHRTFWQDPINEREGRSIPELAHLPNSPRNQSAIIEMAYIADGINDGWYVIYLCPIALPGDAAPLRPMIAPILDFA